MAIIYTYPTKAAAAADKVLISDSADEFKTKNASIDSIRDAINVVDVISPGPGISVSNPTGNVTIGNTGVLSLTAGSNISLSGSTGNITISTSASNVDGSGTTNFIPKWTDSNTLGDSQIFQLGTDIGVGITDPGAKLDVADTSPVIRITNTTTAQGNGIIGSLEFFTKDSSVGGARTVSSIICDNQAGSAVPGGELVFKTSLGGSGLPVATEKMRILSNGNVGIGLTNPSETLHVDGTLMVEDGGDIILSVDPSLGEWLIGDKGKVGPGNWIQSGTNVDFVNNGNLTFTTHSNNNITIGGVGPTTSRVDIQSDGINAGLTGTGDFLMIGNNGASAISMSDAKGTLRVPLGTVSIGDPTGLGNATYIQVDDASSEIVLEASTKSRFTGLVDLPNLNISGAQGNAGDVLTSTGAGIVWSNQFNTDSWFAGCASVGSSSNTASNPRQASFTFPNEVGSSNFGPCIITGADFNVINVSIKWNGSNAPTIGANGTVDFKLGKLTDPAGNPDTQEGTVNYTNVKDLTGLQITSADSGTWINKGYSVSSASFTKGDVVVIVFPRPTTGWTGTGATNGDIQLTVYVQYT